MLTRMTDEDWERVVQVFRAVRSRRGDKGRNDRRFLEALHYFTLHNINWRALPAEFGNWNSVWKRFWRLIPSPGDQNLWAQSRSPMDMISQGRSVSLFHASQQ